MYDDNFVYRFEGFEFDPVAQRLTKDGGEVPLQPRPFALLLYLIEHRDRVVPRAELFCEVWDVSVGSQALGYAVHAIRRALGDDGSQQQWIKTVRGSGLQFAAPVEVVPSPLTEVHLQLREDLPFLGREKMLLVASEAMDSAGEREGGLLFLAGEAGIGKTRAIEELASIAVRRGFQVYGARCAASEGHAAFAPWRQIIQAATRGHTLESLAALLDVAPDDIEWIAARSTPTSPKPNIDPWQNKATRSRLFDIVGDLIKRLCEQGPIFLSLDDAHRADPASLALLSHVAPLLNTLPVMLVASYRETEREDLTGFFLELSNEAAPARQQSFELGGLDADEIKQLLEALSSVGIDAGLAHALEKRTSGNPFFVSLLVDVLANQGRIEDLEGKDLEALALPERVHDAVLLQLTGLSPETVELLELASTSGHEFLLSDLEHCQSASRDELMSLLDSAIRARILRRTKSPAIFGFVHAIVRESIHASLDNEKRVDLHARMARAIESQVEGQEWLRAAELSRHYLEAAPATGLDPALHYLEVAADWSSQYMAFEEAVGFLDQAVESHDAVLSVDVRCRLLVKLGNASNRLGDRARSRVAFLGAVRLAEKAGFHDYVALVALLFAPDFLAVETGVVDPDLVSLLRRALSSSRSDPALRAQLSARLGVALYWSDESVQEVRDLSAHAMEFAKSCNDEYSTAYIDTAVRFSRFSVHEPEIAFSAIARPYEQSQPLTFLVGRVLRVTGCWISGAMARVRSEIEEFSTLSRSAKEPRAEWYVPMWRSSIALMEGRYKDAHLHQEAFTGLGARAGDRNASHSRVLQAFLTSVDVSVIEPFGEPILEMIEKYPRVVGWRAGRLHYELELGKQEEAEDLYLQLVSECALSRPGRNDWYGVACAMAGAAAILRDDRFGRSLYELLLPGADHLAVIGYGSFCYGSVWHLLGQAAIAMGKPSLARDHFSRSVAMNRSVGAMPAMARSLIDLACLELSEGQKVTSRFHIRRAIRICERLKLRRLARKAEVVEAGDLLRENLAWV